MDQNEQQQDAHEQEHTLREEMNFSDFPIARLGARDQRQSIVHEEWVGKKNERRYQKWVASASSALGLPTELGERVLVTLISISYEQEFAKKTVFTVYRICKILGLPINKNSYKAVENVLYQLAGLTIISEEAFYNHAEKKRITTKTAFHIIDTVWLRHVRNDLVPELPGANGYIVWNDIILGSMRAGYIKRLDGTVYFRLKSPLARTMYKLLDKQMYYRDEWEIDIFVLASRLGMAKYKYPSKVIEKLKPAYEELIRDGFLSGVEVVKRGKYTRIRFAKAAHAQSWPAGAEVLPDEPAEHTDDGDTNGDTNDTWRAVYEHYDTTEEHRTTWVAVLQDLALSLPLATYQQYVAHTQLLAITDDEAVIGVVHTSSKDWLEHRMGNKILKTLNSHLDEPVHALTFIALSDFG
jgi:hypothetical protein